MAALALLVAFAPAVHAKRPPIARPAKIDARRIEPTVERGRARVGVTSGVPRALYRVDYPVARNEPETMARQYLAENAVPLRLGDRRLGDLVHRATRRGRAGTTVRFEQRVQGIPVLAPDLAVTIDRFDRVTFVTSGYEPGLSVPTPVPAVSDAAARASALTWLGVDGALAFEATRLVVVPQGKQARLAWQVRMVPAVSPSGDWEVLVDALTGEIFHGIDRALYVNGTGFVYDPDPLGTAHAVYGGAGFADADDATTPELDAARASRILSDLTDIGGGTYKLEGPYARIVDSESPFKGLFTQAGTTFAFDRSQDGFEAVNAYFHIDQVMRHVHQTLGINVMPYQYTGGVRFDPSGMSGADNSHYLSSNGELAFGEGGVDDAEDADVVIHELGHGLHDWLTDGGLSQVEGLSEGFGDYVAQSYSRSLGQWTTSEPPYPWVFNWDGHNPFWAGRITNHAAAYPGGLVGQIHTDGQIWSTCLMKVWDDVGRNKTDAAVFEGIAMTNSGSSQNDAAQAVLQAAVALGYTPAEIQAFATHFENTGYVVEAGIDVVSSAAIDDCPGDPANENGVMEPGETVDLAVTLQAAAFTRTGVSGTLTTLTPGVTIEDGSATWPDLVTGTATGSNAPHFRIGLDQGMTCLSTIDFRLIVACNEAGPDTLTFSRRVGQALVPAGIPAPIPDNSTTGVSSTLSVDSTVALTNLAVRVALTHTWIGDLHIKLRSPAGTEVVLLDRPGFPASSFGCADDDMDVVFDDGAVEAGENHCAGTAPWAEGMLLPVQPLAGFTGQSSAGNWVLTVSDRAGGDVGTLVDWELFTTPVIVGVCKPCEIVTDVAARAPGFGVGPSRPNPFSKVTEIAFELARPGRASLSVYDITGHQVATLLDRELPAGPHTVTWNGTDAAGRAVASGIYFYRLTSGDVQGARRVLLVR